MRNVAELRFEYNLGNLTSDELDLITTLELEMTEAASGGLDFILHQCDEETLVKYFNPDQRVANYLIDLGYKVDMLKDSAEKCAALVSFTVTQHKSFTKLNPFNKSNH